MQKSSLISLALFFIMASQLFGDWSPWWWPETCDIAIVPQNPISSDVVVITLSGLWPDSCIPHASAILVTGNNIFFDVIPSGINCAAVITPWEQTQSVGPLSSGTYTVYARIVGYPYIPETYTPMMEFIVTDYQFVLSTELLTVPEGETATFTVALLNPFGTVEVNLSNSSGDPDITVESGASLTFDSSNYSVFQIVTIAAAEDDDYFNGEAIIQVIAPGFLIAEVTVREVDNDVPSILYVDTNAPQGVKTGRSWEDAFLDLQEALSVATQVSGIEEIHVAQGVYTPAGPFGSRNATFQLIDGVAIKGGYAGFGEPDPNSRNIREYETILSGDLNGDDGPNFTNRGDNSLHIINGSGTDDTTVLDGFTITGGNGAWGGGGIYIWVGSNPTIKNCIIHENRASYGAGIHCRSSSPLVTNCIISGNKAKQGRIDNGGGMYIAGGGSPTINNCTFIGNSANETGGGLCNYSSGPAVNNCIFWNNTVGEGIDESAQIHGTETVINYSCVQGWTGNLVGVGNIGDDPLFVNPANGDYHLLPNSPCIDTGDPNFIPEPNETDLDGWPRVVDGDEDGITVVDMGAYEYMPPISAEVDITPNTLNLQSKGNWITCQIRLPEDYNVTDIDPDSVFLEDIIASESLQINGNVATAKFGRSEVQDIIEVGEVELMISGELIDGTIFEGSDTIRVIQSGGGKEGK